MFKKLFFYGFSAVFLLWAISASNVQGQAAGGGAGGGAGAAVNDTLADEDPNNVEETLIDFTTFEDTLKASNLYKEKDLVREKTIAELDPKNPEEVDPKTLAPAYEIQVSDMLYDRWLVQLNSSANTIQNRRWSYAKKVVLKSGMEYKGGETEAKRPPNGTGNSVLGVRIHFPNHGYNANARISPPYEIRAYDDKGQVISRQKVRKKIGVIDNVGQIKKISVDVSGRNYKYGVAIRLKDQYDSIKEYFMGYTYYANWRRMAWTNPNYITSVDHRQLFRIPLYPIEVPFRKFDSIIIYRPAQEVGGDFVVYFRKIDMWFDYAIPPEALADLDIDDEATWGILKKRAQERQRIETLKLREKAELVRAEKQRMDNNAEPKDVTKTVDEKPTTPPKP